MGVSGNTNSERHFERPFSLNIVYREKTRRSRPSPTICCVDMLCLSVGALHGSPAQYESIFVSFSPQKIFLNFFKIPVDSIIGLVYYVNSALSK